MADENDPDELRRRYVHYVVSPDLIEELKARGAPRGHLSDTDGNRWHAVADQQESEPRLARMIIELDVDFPGGVSAARAAVLARLEALGVDAERRRRAERTSTRYYVFAELGLGELEALTAGDGHGRTGIYRVWRDERLKPFLDRSIRTIKADASLTAFGADGCGIVVAVADSGIDAAHPHFAEFSNLRLPEGLDHRDFTGDGNPLADAFGHGTHVAGIVAGWSDSARGRLRRVAEARDGTGTVSTTVEAIGADCVVRGVAPKAKLVSLKVLDEHGEGHASSLIAALEHVEELNGFGRHIKVHCVNISLGHPFDAAWFAAGHSPLCVVVNRLVRSGTVVVAAAGNDGSTLTTTEFRAGRRRVGLDQSINDPGNAEGAITVGATHGSAPHTFGVSYFSSRGPTADGRVKPDLVAPGERILSCASAGSTKLIAALHAARTAADPAAAYFREESGTSMAAPHVAGAVAALLSIRPEFVGKADAVKAVLVASCVDLKRKADFQGAGLIDLMRAIQSV